MIENQDQNLQVHLFSFSSFFLVGNVLLYLPRSEVNSGCRKRT
jgi:hypothetical protein